MEFVSRTDDKTPHWIISDGSPEPKLIGKEKEGKSDEGGGEESQDVEDKEKPTEKGETVVMGTWLSMHTRWLLCITFLNGRSCPQ